MTATTEGLAVTNIDQFNQITGRVFAELYEAFPSKVSLSPKKIVEDSDIDWNVANASIAWLREYGYLHADSETLSGDFNGSVLTPKGLAILNAVPDSLEVKESYGALLANAAKDTIVEQGKKGLGELAARAIAYGSTLPINIVG